MPRCIFPLLLATITSFFFLLPFTANANPATSPPNVVFIMCDDLGYGDVKCFGEERCQIETPWFDLLAREGIRFTNAHANASVCVPTRVAIMTGRYPWRFGRPGVGGPWGFLGTQFPPTQHTLGTLMVAAGYQCGYVGKWHLGTAMATTDGRPQGPGNVDYSKPLATGPLQYGFNHSFILPGSLDMYPYAFVSNNQWVGEVTAQKGWSAFNRVGPAAVDFEDTKVLDTFASQAESFIATQSKSESPFFLYLALTAPHTPVSPSAPFSGKSPLGIYGDFVMETDDCIGRVLKALETHGLEDETLVIATSDHGAAPYAGRQPKATFLQLKELEKDGHYSCGVNRGYKFSVYEGGFRVPFVARWPGITPAGATCSRLIGLQDLMRTLADLAGVELAGDQGPDSMSFLPLLREPAHPPTRDSMLLQATRGHAVLAGKWKLAMCPGSGCEGTYGNQPTRLDAWRRARSDFGRAPTIEELAQPPFVQLFDLQADPSESKNVGAAHPEKVAELLRLFDRQTTQGRTTPGPPLTNDRPRLKRFPAVPDFVWKP